MTILLRHRFRVAPILLIASLVGSVISADEVASTAAARATWLRAHGTSPAAYVLSQFQDHRVVILAEAHRQRHDVELVIDLIPWLVDGGIDALALEILPAEEQEAIDRLVSAREWDPVLAMHLMRTMAWPFREYLEILHTAWETNRSREPETRPLTVLALGPGSDWRTTLPHGETYDTFMADRIEQRLNADPSHRVLVYCGAHHAFTRYVQPERPIETRVDRFFERMGNKLWRDIGEDVFLIGLHRPFQCRRDEQWGWCLPFDGAIDCAASSNGKPVGFDIAGSPFSDLRFAPGDWYGMGYPDLRMVDFADGWIWMGPVDSWQGVHLIPLEEYAPDEEAFAEVLANNPFTDETVDRAGMEELWKHETSNMIDFVATRPWRNLAAWRDSCAEAKADRK